MRSLKGIDARHVKLRAVHSAMPDSNRPNENKEAKSSRSDEARRIIADYVADLRELIRKLAPKLH